MIGSGGFGNSKPHTQPMAEINTTPMVDIMLVLLVIFIITAPLLTHAVKVDLPQTNGKPQPEKPEIITLSIDKSGSLFWDDKPMAKSELSTRLQQIMDKEPQPELHLRADKETRYQILAEIMAEAQTVGVTKMGFVNAPK
jgi:biopolymer transport protein ExbD